MLADGPEPRPDTFAATPLLEGVALELFPLVTDDVSRCLADGADRPAQELIVSALTRNVAAVYISD